MKETVEINVSSLSKIYYDSKKSTLWSHLFENIEASHKGKKSSSKSFNSVLCDICFSVKNGTALGIIGTNGSGKSTLLQIISGVLKPSKGNLSVQGKIACILELGSGFNLEFTGRENIYINFPILRTLQTLVNTSTNP